MIITSKRNKLESRSWYRIAAFEKFFQTVINDILIIFGGDIDNRSKNSKKVVFGDATSMLNFRELSEVKKMTSDGINRPPIC